MQHLVDLLAKHSPADLAENRHRNRMLAFAQATQVARLDKTGGAPELNPYFRDLVRRARSLGIHVMDRCNLTILAEP